MNLIVGRAAACAALLLGMLVARPVLAMPPFAQAYGISCSVCHTQVPALNAYGRYVQRTGYASLDHSVLKRSVPVWIGANTWYDSQDPAQPHHLQFGNVAIHAAGELSQNWSYHAHTWFVQNNEPGGVDTLWVAYNNLLHRDGHLFVGKIEAPGPSPFSQWFDLAGFSTPSIIVGEHAYATGDNRWGVKLGYTHANITAEAGYLFSGQDLGGLSDFGSDTDKTVQWKIAYANPQRPLEAGFFGSRGSYPLAEGGVDQYVSTAAYVQRDPTRGMPGVLAMYQTAYDAQPLPGLSGAHSNASTLELYEPLGARMLVSARKEFSNDGMGTSLQSGNVDVSYKIAPFLQIYGESALTQNGKPAWRYMLWWTTPLSRVR